jgi:dsDNA-specific endonuclease/ATPase MutS2
MAPAMTDPDDEDLDLDAPIELPIDGTLDLHLFAPREIPDLVATYLDECRARGILQVRIVHGKGTGTQRRIVQGVLERHPAVRGFRPADERAGGWGATLVELSPA